RPPLRYRGRRGVPERRRQTCGGDPGGFRPEPGSVVGAYGRRRWELRSDHPVLPAFAWRHRHRSKPLTPEAAGATVAGGVVLAMGGYVPGLVRRPAAELRRLA